MKNTFVTAIIVAAGNSTRMGGSISKQFISIKEKTVIEHTLTAFENCNAIDEVVIVARQQDIAKIKEIADKTPFKKVKNITTGGDTRGDSVSNGIKASSVHTTHFAIHDGARPMIKIADIEAVVNKAIEVKSATLGVMIKDTIKTVDSENLVVSTPNRDSLRGVQTPQVFEKELYISALAKAESEGKNFTDDCQLIENYGDRVQVVLGSESNIKITTPYDVIVAESILNSRENGDNI